MQIGLKNKRKYFFSHWDTHFWILLQKELMLADIYQLV